MSTDNYPIMGRDSMMHYSTLAPISLKHMIKGKIYTLRDNANSYRNSVIIMSGGPYYSTHHLYPEKKIYEKRELSLTDSNRYDIRESSEFEMAWLKECIIQSSFINENIFVSKLAFDRSSKDFPIEGHAMYPNAILEHYLKTRESSKMSNIIFPNTTTTYIAWNESGYWFCDTKSSKPYYTTAQLNAIINNISKEKLDNMSANTMNYDIAASAKSILKGDGALSHRDVVSGSLIYGTSGREPKKEELIQDFLTITVVGNQLPITNSKRNFHIFNKHQTINLETK